MGKTLVIIGLVIVIVGLIIHFSPKLPGMRIPGDIVIERKNFKFYFPIATSIILSILLSLIFYFINRGK
jgi:hypothetical protein